MEVKMQLEEECKNMENNKVFFKFLKENEELSLNLDSPNFSEFVKSIINKNYYVSEENISISTLNDDKNIDIDSLKNIVIEVHKKYMKDLNEFYKNIETEISTYYDDEDKLLNEIEEYVRQEKSKDIVEKSEIKNDIEKSKLIEEKVLVGVGE